MTRRARNVAGAVLLLVLALYGGKWLTGFLTIRWWAAAFSPDAVAAVTRWRLLGLGLDSIAVAVASIWFVAQVWMVKATINAIHVRRELDDRIEWHPVPERMMVQGAVALGVLLGLLTGSGAGSGVGQVALAIGAPRFGIEDISTGLDLGSLVSWYPVLLQIQRFLLTLGLIGLAISLLLYLLLDSAAGKPFRPVLRQERRLHYSLSLTVIALALVLGALLIPLHLGTSVDAPTGDTAGTVRIAAGYALAGVAAASALLTLWWGVSTARHTVLISTWIVLAVAELTGRVLVPALTADSGSGVERARLMRQLDSLMYGIRLRGQAAAEDSLPVTATIWDPELLAAGRATEFLLGAGPSGSDTAAAWLVATRSGDESTIDVRKVSAFEVDRHGAPIEIGAPRRIAGNRAIPGEDGWKQVEHGGVRVGGVLRRLAIAWALQAPGILSLPRDAEIDWWLDPRERARALVPALEWRAVGATMSNGDLIWILAGMSTLERAPLSTRVGLGPRTVAALVPVAAAVIGASDGTVSLFLDPAADSIGTAWARWFGEVIAPPDQLPAEVAMALPYPREWFAHQLTVLSQPHWNMGVLPRGREPDRISQTWSPRPGSLQGALLDSHGTGIARILTAAREPGGSAIRSVSVTRGEIPTAAELADAWRGLPVLAHLADSVTAAGDSLFTGPVRWQRTTAGLVAWQPFTAVGDSGVRLVWMGTMTTDRMGGGRDPLSAWVAEPTRDNSGGIDSGSATPAPLRTWIMRADSALARGDLTAFARAWEAIRGFALEAAPE